MDLSKMHRRSAILAALKAHGGLMTSGELTEVLESQGLELSERTVRLYLQELDKGQLTENRGRRGRRITAKGLSEIDAVRTFDRVGFLSGKIDAMAYRMSFDLALRTGSIVVNTSIVDPRHYLACAAQFEEVFARGYAMGHLAALLGPGESVGGVTVPENMVGICTVCSITLNGVLLKHGVPMHSRFGGLLELAQGKPQRFVEMINYDGTTVDPLEVFIRSAMTNYLGAIDDGNGYIGAGFREIPADSRQLVVDLAAKLDAIGLGGFMRIGQSGQDLFGIPVNEGRVGAVVIGGLNPMAVFEESGNRIRSWAMSGLLEYSRLVSYKELAPGVEAYLKA